MAARGPFLWRDGPGGRAVSWRVWVLICLLPGVMAAGALFLVFEQLWKQAVSVPAVGVVDHVYSWPGETLFDRGQTLYSPRMRYTEPDGQTRAATVGLAHPGFDFALGSEHAIRIFPGRDRDAMLPGLHNWMAAIVVGLLAAVLALPALWAHLRLRKWLAG